VRVRFGEDRSERLDYRPASLFVVERVRAKYVCRSCAGRIVTAPAPAEALPKCVAGPGLLAHVIVSKYADHLPLHRLEGILVALARSNATDSGGRYRTRESSKTIQAASISFRVWFVGARLLPEFLV
jgi:transposase